MKEELTYYTRYTPEEYMKILEGKNLRRKAELSQVLTETLPDVPDDLAIIMVGSDGKLERHPQSRTEIVLLTQDQHSGLRKHITDKLLPIQDEHSLEFDIENAVAQYYLTQKAPFAYQYQRAERVFPGFVFNAQLVYGNEETFISSRRRILEEVVDESETARRILRHMRTQLKDYRRSMKTGFSGKSQYFDLETNTAFYDDRENILGFKGSFIRGIQRMTGLHLAQFAKKHQKLIPNLAHTFPTRTIDRIHILTEYDCIAPTLAAGTIQAYNWFLQRHHEIQHLFKEKGEQHMVMTPFDRALFDQYQQPALQYTYSLS